MNSPQNEPNAKDVKIDVPLLELKMNLFPPQIVITQINWKRDWSKLAIVAIVTVGSPILTGFWVTGWLGVIVGIVIGIGAFFLGLWAVTKVVTKTISS